MASYVFMTSVASLVICALSIPAASVTTTTPPPPPPTETQIGKAVMEMQKAGYYSFAMLINMVQEGVQGHVTFLVPSDEALSETPPAEGRVLEFLQVHSIPAALLYEDLRRLPDGTAIPTNRTGYAVEISSRGGGGGGGGNRVGVFLNGTEVVRANVCVDGSSIRCHGINRVLNVTNSSRCRSPSCPAPAPAPRSLNSPVDNGQSGRSGGGRPLLLLMTYQGLFATITLLIALLF